MDCGLPGSFAHAIFQARILESVSFPSPGDLPHPGIKPTFPVSQADSLLSEPSGKPRKITAGQGAARECQQMNV